MSARLTTLGQGGYIRVGTQQINLNLNSPDDYGFIDDLVAVPGGVMVITEGKYKIHCNVTFRHSTTVSGLTDTITLTIRVNGNRVLVEQLFSYSNTKSNSFSVTTSEKLKPNDVITCHIQSSTDRSSLQVDTSRYFTYLLIDRD